VCHGKGEPNVHPFFYDIRKELNRLNPNRTLMENETRGVTVTVRAIIADAPARCWMCGIKGCAGFFACPRCKIEGVHPQYRTEVTDSENDGDDEDEGIPLGPNEPSRGKKFMFTTAKNVKFPTINNDEKRVFSEWAQYAKPSNPLDRSKVRLHRVGKTPLDKIADVNPINDVPLEEMHLMDLGVLKDTVAFLLNLKVTEKKTTEKPAPKRRRRKNDPVDAGKKKTLTKCPRIFIGWNQRIVAWSKYTPREFARSCESLENFGQWKATLYRQFFMYYMVALMYVDEMQFDGQKKEAVLHMILGYRLLTGNTHKPVPPSRIVRGQEHLNKAFHIMTSLSNGSWCTYKCHCMSHLADDVRYFECHLGSLSGYTFESQMIFFRQMGLQGNRVIKQIANRLVEKSTMYEGLDDGNETASNYDDETFDSFYANVKRNQNSRPNMTVTDVLDLPPFFVHAFNEYNKIVRCESFTITEKFPDNVVRLFCHNKLRRKKNAFCIEKIERDDTGKLVIEVREFKNLENTFSKPYASSSIGNFVASTGLKDYTEKVPFSLIIGKYFAFPHFLHIFDKDGKYDPHQPDQSWCLQDMAHGA
jgi:hypothetical protein